MISNEKVLILFGTQTGNSEDVADRILRYLKRMHIKAQVVDINEYTVTNLVNESLVIFVCSTTGNGEFPDNMKSFWKFLLRKNLPSNSLCQLNFCVFGLGDSSYEKFNVVSKKLNKRLIQLGATEIIPLTLGDDQHELGYDAALDPWLLNLKNTILSFFTVSDPPIPEDVPLPPRYKVKFCNELLTTDEFQSTTYNRNKSFPLATLKKNERVTAVDHFQAVHHLEFEIDSTVHYDPGDVAVVWPENPPEEVEDFLSLLNVPLDTNFILIPSDVNTPLPKINPYPCTVRQCAVSYFDILSVPRRSFFEVFHHFSQDELEKEKLVEFTTAAGQEELYDYCNRPRRTILEVLKDFPHTTPHVPFDYLFDMIPSIRPRSFSIASALKTHPQEFHLLVAVVQYKTRLMKSRQGLCSNWLAKLKLGTIIPYYIKRGSIVLPETNVPIIMVGPGTGCAPFRAFTEERASAGVGDNYLFFGCRYKTKDFLFSEVWLELCEKKMLTIFTAFSRDQDEKIYVQHRIAENGPLIWDLIQNKKGVIYIAGNAKQMPEGVKDAFMEIIKKQGNLNEDESVKYLQTLEHMKRYQIETWA
ncbi:NADPH-dependent diflavin oxidoreductase 1-like [Argiope bruennichi]|uniref:NADPH-dependent diflavin oxidoreductase 1 n=1 Tax=Argiope bruennichi TaxID=94029 RepID=A0A8T0EWS1_ARGBR|nr:NADPH-dependent diflavin oxidoreductase 1-like [Argiope bruennichi]KAF8782796.1 NADPH-dependent diflavin oxidoreductase 1 like protein [Argiope bruennichi]